MKNCVQCNIPISLYATKYCSNRCQSDYQYTMYIANWQQNNTSGTRGITTKNLSAHIVRYIMEKYNKQCARCGWHEINATTGKSPLEIDHMDGNSENSQESNLILLCPNCHALTANYKSLNNGKGRLWRREKYVKIVKTPL